MARSRAKQGGGNSGVTLKDENGKVIRDGLGRKRYAPRKAREAHPVYTYYKERALKSAQAEWARERASRSQANSGLAVYREMSHLGRHSGRGD